jgi:hypothetical protein
MLAQAGICLHRLTRWKTPIFLITATGSTVVLFDTAFLDGSWQHASKMGQSVTPLWLLSLLLSEAMNGASRWRSAAAFFVFAGNRLKSRMCAAQFISPTTRRWTGS